MGRLGHCLLAVTLLPGYSLLAQEAHVGSNFNWDRGAGTVPISIGGFTLSPRNAPALVLDDSGAGTGPGNPLDIYTSNSTGAQAWSANNTGVTPPGFYNFAALGPYCITASGPNSGSAVVLDPCAGTAGQAWDPVLIGDAYEFQPNNSTNMCLTASAADPGSAVVVDTCTGAPNQLWSLAVETNSSNTGKGGPDASQCHGIGGLSVAGVTYKPTWCQEFEGPARPPSTEAWNFDLGNNNGWGNGEAEVYCGPPGVWGNPSQCPTTFSTATAPVYIDGNGHLVIQPRNVNGTWISARLQYEWRADLPVRHSRGEDRASRPDQPGDLARILGAGQQHQQWRSMARCRRNRHPRRLVAAEIQRSREHRGELHHPHLAHRRRRALGSLSVPQRTGMRTRPSTPTGSSGRQTRSSSLWMIHQRRSSTTARQPSLRGCMAIQSTDLHPLE